MVLLQARTHAIICSVCDTTSLIFLPTAVGLLRAFMMPNMRIGVVSQNIDTQFLSIL